MVEPNKLLSLSADTYDNRVLQVGFKNPVSTQDRADISAAWNAWNAKPTERDRLFERLVKRLKSTAKWCPNCGGRGSHTGWDKKRLTTKRVDCRRCAPTRDLLAEVAE